MACVCPQVDGRDGHAVQAGFDHFIDLTEADERLEPYADIAVQAADWLSVKFVHERCPIVDVSVPRSPQETAGILDAIDRALDDGSTVYVHCWGGVGRTVPWSAAGSCAMA